MTSHSRAVTLTSIAAFFAVLAAATVVLVSARAGSDPPLRRITTSAAEATSLNPSVSGDGLRVAFESSADLLRAGRHSALRLFSHDAVTGGVAQLADARAPAAALSQDGARAAFASNGDPLGSNSDGNWEIFYHDGQALRQLTNTRPDEPSLRAVQGCFLPSLSDDGRYVAFSSDRDLTGYNPDLNLEIFVYDANAVTVIQLTDTAGARGASDAKISGDGTRVAYVFDPHPAGEQRDGAAARRDLVVVERETKSEVAALRGLDGLALTRGRAFSDDGLRVAYSALTAPDAPQVFILDGRNGHRARQLTNLGPRSSDVPPHATISGDGLRVAFATRRRVTTPNSDGGVELYAYDIPSAEFLRITDTPANSAEIVSSLSDDGSTVVFNFSRILADPETPQTFAGNSEIFAAAVPPRAPYKTDARLYNGAVLNAPAPALAHGSIAVVTGSNLAIGAAEASRRADGVLPTRLLNTSVEVSGRAAELFYVSPTRINFLVPEHLPEGPAELTVRNHDGYETRAALNITSASPGVFTANGTGTGEAVALDAEALLRGPFDATDGAGAPRRLIVFATGLRHAVAITAEAGGRPLRVEAVLPSPDLPGLDQVHLVASGRLRGAGTIPLVLSAGEARSNTASLTFTGGGAAPRPARLSLSPDAATVPVGGELKFTAAAFDAEGEPIEGQVVNFSVSDEGVAALLPGGVARGLSAGETTVIAEAAGLRAESRLKVVERTVVVNEVLADPPDGAAGDANRDGTRDGSSDEFVELVNGTDEPVGIGGWTIRTRTLSGTAETVRHAFAQGMEIQAGDAVVIFGGGAFDPENPVFGGSQVLKASSGGLSLTNSGLTLLLRDPAGNLVSQFSYGAGDNFGGDAVNQSVTRSPDVTGGFVRHTTADGARRYSPGLRLDGTFFRERRGRPARVTIEPESQKVFEGATALLTARAFDQFGRPMGRVAFSFGAGGDHGSAVIESVTADDTGALAEAVVRGVRPGLATFTATASDGTASAESAAATVEVAARPPEVKRVEISPASPVLNRGADVRLTATAYDENEGVVSGANFVWSSDDPSVASVTAEGLLRGEGPGDTYVTVSTHNGPEGSVSARAAVSVRAPLVINELLADVPPDDPATAEVEGDANRDGVRDSGADEFVEVVNASAETLDVSGVRLSDAVGVRFTFPANTTLAPGQSAVVFGGGNPAHGDPAFGGSLVFRSNGLSLNDAGDSVAITLQQGSSVVTLDSVVYGAGSNTQAAADQSLTRTPDTNASLGGGRFVPHREAEDSDGRPFSAGLRADGTPFNSPQLTRIEVTPTAFTLGVGSTQTFAARAYGISGGAETEVGAVSFRWGLTEAGRAKLSTSHGASTEVTALAAGTLLLRARAGGIEGTATLDLDNPPPPAPTPAPTPDTTNGVVISQVFGGGGNSGALYRNDFIELFNRGETAVDLEGWSVQYAGAGGSTWQKTDLSGVILPGRYYLVREAAGSGGTSDLPAPDASGEIAMSASAGKVALVRNRLPLEGACPTGGAVVDFVGYGTAANCFEGTGPAPTGSNTAAVLRRAGGCTDTGDSREDFHAAAPEPRNSASAENRCDTSAHGTAGGPPSAAGLQVRGLRPYLFGAEVSELLLPAGSTRWRRGVWAYGLRGMPGGQPRPPGAWP